MQSTLGYQKTVRTRKPVSWKDRDRDADRNARTARRSDIRAARRRSEEVES